VSPSRSRAEAAPRRPGYHHGDLRSALVDAAVELIAEQGVRSFSLAEAGRRVGVSAAAPYRHFDDRESLLAAVAVRALDEFAALVEAATTPGLAPEARLRALAAAYVRFAGERRALFESVFSAGIEKARYPDVRAAEARVNEPFDLAVGTLFPGDPAAAEALAEALVATIHGHAILLLDGQFAQAEDPTAAACAKASTAVAALIAGRACFGTPDQAMPSS
jgi:AcrR family transcriptional regulator